MIKDYFVLSIKNLRRKGIRSWLTLIGIFIGVAAVISLISIGDGLKTAVNAQFGVSSTELISVQAGGLTGFGAPGTGVSDPLTQDDADAISKISEVDIVFTRNIETVDVDFNDKLTFTSATSIPEERKKFYEFFELNVEKGRLLDEGDNHEVLVGYNYGLEDRSGFDKALRVGDRILVKGKKFEVVGILEKKGSFIFDGVIFMNNDALEDLAGYGDEVDIIAVRAKDKELIDRTKEKIERLLRQRRDVEEGEENFEVSTPEATLETVNSILGYIQVFIVIIASISILVGAIGIINTMTTSVLERRNEIGIMKAIGARNENVFFQFFVEAGLVGLIGGLMGIILGLGLAFLGIASINSFLGSEASINFDLILIFGSLAGSFLIGAVSGVGPALQAAKQNPVEALRG